MRGKRLERLRCPPGDDAPDTVCGVRGRGVVVELSSRPTQRSTWPGSATMLHLDTVPQSKVGHHDLDSSAMKVDERSSRERHVVDDIADAGRASGLVFRDLSLGGAVHGSGRRHLSAVDTDRNLSRVARGAAVQCSLAVGLHRTHRHRGLNRDLVADALHVDQEASRIRRNLLLESSQPSPTARSSRPPPAPRSRHRAPR